MKTLKYSDILARNGELGKQLTGKPYRVALISNIVINQLGEILEFVLRERGINANVVLGDYDNIVQDSLRLKNVDAIVIFWESANLIDGLHANVESLEFADLNFLAERVEREIELVLANTRHVPIVLFNRFSALQFVKDDLRSGTLQKLCDRLNATLDRLVSPHQIVVNLDGVLAKVGLNASADFRQFQSSKALYTIEFFKYYADHVIPAFLAVTGKVRKVLVLDCDNTLWGGVLGEEGDSQIRMNNSTRAGRVFGEVQRLLNGFRKQGVLLALSSKNNAEDVDRILSEHPDMLLRSDSWVAKKVNWQDKATNLRQMALELNLGLDSFVFVDDSPFEIGLVKDELPQVKCVLVPEVLSDYPAVIRRLAREFFVLSSTAEDLRKTEMYKEEQARDGVKAKFASLDDYLKSLGLKVRVSWNTGISVSRAAQLTQKTNQFNLTTHRYTESDIERMLADPGFALATLAVSDRYGDYGIVGLAIVQFSTAGSLGSLDTFLMSCRVIGRNVERAFFDYLVHKLRTIGVEKVQAEYIKTSKNEQVTNLYPSFGFSSVAATATVNKYDLMLADYQQSGIDYIEVIEDVG